MSSHREAPEIAKDPVADSTDLYAFVSPDRPRTVTLIANYIPLQEPAGGPNFYEFGNDVLYEIHIDNDGDGFPEISYQFRFHTKLTTPESFLYNTGPITSLTDPNWNSKQFYSVTRVDRHGSRVLGSNLACPPCNVGILSTPHYEARLGSKAVHSLGNGISVFAGQRAEEFYVDLGSIFDLANLRPFQQANVFGKLAGLVSQPGVNATNRLNVHSVAIQVPTNQLVRAGRPTIGVWTTASRPRVMIAAEDGDAGLHSGPFGQVSRLGNPLINEVIIRAGQQGQMEQAGAGTRQAVRALLRASRARRAAARPVPGVFPHLAALGKSGKARADIEAILLTGIGKGIVPGFTNFTGPVRSDMLRLNTSIPPTPASSVNILGVLGGDLAGFPNGRRIVDDVVTIELRALAGLTYPLIDPSYQVDPTVKVLSDGLTNSSVANRPLDRFPYMGIPYSGYRNPS